MFVFRRRTCSINRFSLLIPHKDRKVGQAINAYNAQIKITIGDRNIVDYLIPAGLTDGAKTNIWIHFFNTKMLIFTFTSNIHTTPLINSEPWATQGKVYLEDKFVFSRYFGNPFWRTERNSIRNANNPNAYRQSDVRKWRKYLLLRNVSSCHIINIKRARATLHEYLRP